MSSRARRSGSSRRSRTGTRGLRGRQRLRRQRRLHRDRDLGTGLTLTANAHYWAGKPAITTVELVTDIGGQSPVEVFEAGDLDYTPIDDSDASWIAYDETLGPQLREVPQFVVEYYGFDTSKPPFDDVRGAPGRRDGRRLAPDLASSGRRRATRRRRPRWSRRASRAAPTRTACPTHDPDAGPGAARRGRLPGRRRLPGDHDADRRRVARRGIVDELKRELGITVTYETMAFGDYFARLAADPPAIWSLGWVADYPGRNDFLGVLLGDGLNQQLRPLALRRRSMRRSPTPAPRRTAAAPAPPTTAPRRSSHAMSRSSRSVRDRLGAVTERAPGRRPERSRDPAHGGAGWAD